MLSSLTAEPRVGGPAEMPVQGSSRRVHAALAACSAVLLAFCIIASPKGAMHQALPLIETVLLLTGPLLVPAALLHEKKKWEKRKE